MDEGHRPGAAAVTVVTVKKPKPPEILRKSHWHSDRKERAAAKEELRHDLEELSDDIDTEGEPESLPGADEARADEVQTDDD